MTKDDVALGPFRSPKEMALLVYLAHTGQPQSRDFMAEFLWEDRLPEQARSNLRTVLTRLRKQAGEDELIVTR
ncbi:hypothetical protein GC175_20200 [bacterium]|nr:hypothetical protein [bacterium]